MQRTPAPTSQLLARILPPEVRAGAPKLESLDLDIGRLVGGFLSRIVGEDGLERLLPIGICLLLAVAAVVSTLPTVSASSNGSQASSNPDDAAPLSAYVDGDGPNATNYSDLYLGDGSLPNTLQNPGLGGDASTLLVRYTVRGGDTLAKIAARFGLATATVYWANKASLPDPSSIRVGMVLIIPPMDGLLVTVGAKDTLESIAARYGVDAQSIVDVNNLPEAKVTAGQLLLIPGATGGSMPQPKTPTSNGGGWVWPVAGTNFISQYYWSGHHAIDIAAAEGTPVVAAASGTVVMAGWRSYTGGGNVVWIEHGAKLYTTYNHLSRWKVSAGQRVKAGQLIGYVGQTGVATGPHLHFEVWLGLPWGLGDDSDAVNPCRYLAGC